MEESELICDEEFMMWIMEMLEKLGKVADEARIEDLLDETKGTYRFMSDSGGESFSGLTAQV